MKLSSPFLYAVLFYCMQCCTHGFSPLCPSSLTSTTRRFPRSRGISSLSDQPEQSEESNKKIETPRTRPLDPLLVSVTRNNDPTYDPNAPKVSVPLIGELALDRSLFVFLPVAAFAVLGLISSVVVLFNSRDVFVDAVQQSTAEILTPTTTVIDPDACRGLCSQQEANLEDMRVFMNKFARK